MNDLQDSPEYKFADWARRHLPGKTVGVYTGSCATSAEATYSSMG